MRSTILGKWGRTSTNYGNKSEFGENFHAMDYRSNSKIIRYGSGTNDSPAMIKEVHKKNSVLSVYFLDR